MADVKGYYSVIQYCPDASRLETVNVGVLLYVPELKFAGALTTKSNQRVSRLFGRDSYDPDGLNAAKGALIARVNEKKGQFESLIDLERFVETRGNDLALTKVRSIRVTNPEMDLSHLFKELVGEGKQLAAVSSLVEHDFLDEVFHRPSLTGRIRFNQSVTIPVISKPLRIPYAYQNGALNLVKPHAFATNENKAIASAMELAVEGDLLQTHLEELENKRRLIVVAKYPDKLEQIWKDRIRGVLREYDVRAVDREEIGRFIQEVENEAHLLE